MKYSQSIFTKPYAKAYLNTFSSALTSIDIDHMKKAVYFFKAHHNFMSLVNVLVCDSDQNHTIVKELFECFSLPDHLKSLLAILKEHKKLILFPQVLQDICCLYGIRNNILELTIFCASTVTEQEIEKFKEFFVKQANKNVITNVQIDPTLIAGVRMQSDFYMWEYSIASRLKKLRQNMMIKG